MTTNITQTVTTPMSTKAANDRLVSALEKKAYRYAASFFLTFMEPWDSDDRIYEGYIKLVEHYDQTGELDHDIALVWSKFEMDGVEQNSAAFCDSILGMNRRRVQYVLVDIDFMAQAIISMTTATLANVKEGLVDAVIEGTLPDDYHHLNMLALAEAGANE